MNCKILLIVLFVSGLSATVPNDDIHFCELLGLHSIDSQKEISIPDIMRYEMLNCDFHMHTIFSNGKVTPQERMVEVWHKDLDVFAIKEI